MSTRVTNKAQRSQSAKVHRYVDRQLDRTRRQVKSTELITHLLVATIFVVGFLQLVALVDAWVWSLNSVARWMSFIVLAGSVAAYILLTIGPLLLRKIHPDYAAKMIEDAQPTFKNSLLNYVSLRKRPEVTHSAVMDAVTKQAAIDLQTVPQDATVDRSSIIRIGFCLLGLITFVAFYWMLSPKDPLQSFSRVLLPAVKKSAPSIVQVADVSPGDQDIFFGDPVVVSATIKGQFDPQDVQLIYSTADGQVVDRTLPMQPQSESSNRYEAMLTTGQGGVQQGLVYKVVARDGVSPDYEIVVRPNPSITLKSVEVTPPEYTLLAPETVAGQGTIEAVEGSLIKVNATANLPIKLAYIELLVKRSQDESKFAVVESVSMAAEGMEAHGEFHAIYNYQAQKQRATHFRVKFLSTEDDANQNARVHAIRVIPDLTPEVEVLNPIQNVVRLPINETLLIDVRATDLDYGISSIELEMQNNGTNLFRKQKLPLQSEDGKKRVRGQFQFAPEKYFLRVGETVLFTATANDNRTSYLSRSLDPNQTSTRPYQIEILDAVDNPKRPTDRNPKDDQQQPDPQNVGEENKQADSEDGDSQTGDSQTGDSQSEESSGDGDGGAETGEQGSDGDRGQSGDEGAQEGETDHNGDDGGDQGKSQSKDSQSGGQGDRSEDGTRGDRSQQEGSNEDSGGEGEMDTDSQEGAGASEGDSGDQGSSNPNRASEGGSDSDPNAATENRGQENQGQESADGQGDNGHNGSSPSEGQQDSGLQDGQRKPLGDDAADGDVMSRIEEIINEENAKEESGNQESADQESANQESAKAGDATGQRPDGQDQNPAEQNTGRGTDPQQENPRQSQGTGSMQEDDYQPPKDAQGGDNNAQRGEGESKTSQGEKNGNAKGSSGNQTGDQSNEGASSEDSNTGQSNEVGGDDPGDASAESSNQNEQGAGKSENGQRGKPGQSDDEGADASDQPGKGNQGNGQSKAGGDKPKQPGESSGDSGEPAGSENKSSGEFGQADSGQGESGQGESGDRESGQAETGDGKSGGQPGQSGEAGGSGESGESGETGESQSGEGQSGAAPPSESQAPRSDGQPGTSGGSTGSGPGGETVPEKENLEHTKAATDMVLKRLEQERFDPDPQLLEELNWSKEDLNQFLDRWQQMKAAAGTGDAGAQKRYEKALKSLGLSSDAQQKKVRGVSDKRRGFNTDSAVNRPPQEIAPGYRAFQRARNRSKN